LSFRCTFCGYKSIKWLGKCPNCQNWNTFSEYIESGEKDIAIEFTKLSEVKFENITRFMTGLHEVDRVLGGGIVPGSLVLLGGEPGIGKSTLLLSIGAKLSEKNYTSIYISGEESAEQILNRARRISANIENLYITSETRIDKTLSSIKEITPVAIFVDSIQTMRPNPEVPPGTLVAIRDSTMLLLEYAKKSNVAVFIVGHVTKEGNIAGPKILEHIVDTVLYFEGDKNRYLRILRAYKNRFGSTNEIGLFKMEHKGLIMIKNPSEFFIENKKEQNLAGSAITVTLEGNRFFVIEIQALTTPSNFGNPRRVVQGLDLSRANMLIAVIEKKLGLHIFNQDVFLNVAGGMRLTEPASDLAVIAAICSAFKELSVDSSCILIGEVGLLGDVRPVVKLKERIQEVRRLGFKKVIGPAGDLKLESKSLNYYPCKTIVEALKHIFP